MANNQGKMSNKNYRLLIFWIGIFATLCYRLVIVMNNYSRLWVDIVWYAGTIGYIWYFAHRFRVEEKRSRLIKSEKLIYKINQDKKLDHKDKANLLYVLKSLNSSKVKWNYITIFFLSAVALAYDIVFKILKNFQ
ncbi:MAG: hypothetical protein AAB906_01265 [Patescibacteria group bacterium]